MNVFKFAGCKYPQIHQIPRLLSFSDRSDLISFLCMFSITASTFGLFFIKNNIHTSNTQPDPFSFQQLQYVLMHCLFHLSLPLHLFTFFQIYKSVIYNNILNFQIQHHKIHYQILPRKKFDS